MPRYLSYPGILRIPYRLRMPSVSHDANLHFQTLKTLKKSFRLGPDSEDLRDRRVIYVVVQFMRFGL
jgi:hypothetical protein